MEISIFKGYEVEENFLSLGPELISVVDSEFSADSGFWTKFGVSVSIANGVCHFNNSIIFDALGVDGLFLVGRIYRIRVQIINYVSGRFYPSVGGNGFGGDYGSNLVIDVRRVATVNKHLRLYSYMNGSTFDIDNISVQQIFEN